MADSPPHFLFIGYANQAKSPMAEALLNHHAGLRASATSGGIYPSSVLADEVRAVLEEVGVPPPEHAPRKVDKAALDSAREVVCVTDAVPDHAYRRPLTRWDVETPIEGDLESFRRVRDRLDEEVRALLARHGMRPVRTPEGAPA